jgi:hypothetical protein
LAEIEVAIEDLSHDAMLEQLAREILTQETAHSALLREFSRSPTQPLTRPTEVTTICRERRARSVQSMTTAA